MISLRALISVATAEQILEFGLGLARVVGLPVDSWRVGDPTRSLYKYLAEKLAQLEAINAEFIRAGFLSTASGDWLKVLASEVYGVEVQEATHATPTATVTNTGGGFYPRVAGDLTFRSSVTGKTYTTTTGGDINPLSSAAFDLIADEPGSDSSVAADEIDELVTTLLGVEVTSSTASLGADAQSEESIKEQCEASKGALSPNGPGDAYEFVARNSELTGTKEITRARAIHAGVCSVAVYVASSTGEPTTPALDAVQTALDLWAAPLGFASTAIPATEVPINVSVEIAGNDLPGDLHDVLESALLAYLAALPIGAVVYPSALVHLVHKTVPKALSVTLLSPAAENDPDSGDVATLGALLVTEV